METAENIISITLLKRTFKIKCPPHMEGQLRHVAEKLNERLMSLHYKDDSSNVNEIMAITALNLMHELSDANHQYQDRLKNIDTKIMSLCEQVESVI